MYLFLSLFCPVTFSPRLIRADQVRCAKTEHFTPATDTFCDPPQQKLHFPRKISQKTSAGSTEARGGPSALALQLSRPSTLALL